MSTSQTGILAPLPRAAHYVTLAIAPGVTAREVLEAVRALRIDDSVVIGLGMPLVGERVAGLRAFPAYASPAGPIPSTQAAMVARAAARTPVPRCAPCARCSPHSDGS